MNIFIESVLIRLQEIFNPSGLGEQLAQGVANILVGLVVFFVFFLLWRIARFILRKTILTTRLDETAYSFAETTVKYAIMTIGLVSALDAVGIDTGAILASLGVLGVTIGFAARDSLSNLISGIIIFLDRPFVIGDLVEIDDKYGRVSEITLRSTRVVTSDGRMLAVPNTEVINKTVASYTNFPNLRLDIPVTISVQEDIQHVREILLGLVELDPEFLQEPAPRMVVTELNDYNVTVELQAWLENERNHVERRSDLRERAFNALNKAGVDMPFETIQLAPMQVNLAS